MASAGEAAAALALVVAAEAAVYSSKTTTPPWEFAPHDRRVLYQPATEAYSPWPVGGSPTASEVAAQAEARFSFTPRMLLQEASDRLLGGAPRPPERLTLRLASEGLRRLLDFVDPLQSAPPSPTSRFTRSEVEAVAAAAFEAAGITPAAPEPGDGHPSPAPLGPGDATCLPLEAAPLPAWVALPAWAGHVAGRAAMRALGLRSRFVDLGPDFGTMHYFDSHPPEGEGAALLGASPPLLVLHGMFANSLSVGLLGAALSSRPSAYFLSPSPRGDVVVTPKRVPPLSIHPQRLALL